MRYIFRLSFAVFGVVGKPPTTVRDDDNRGWPGDDEGRKMPPRKINIGTEAPSGKTSAPTIMEQS
jgi:hypothetical protein